MREHRLIFPLVSSLKQNAIFYNDVTNILPMITLGIAEPRPTYFALLWNRAFHGPILKIIELFSVCARFGPLSPLELADEKLEQSNILRFWRVWKVKNPTLN